MPGSKRREGYRPRIVINPMYLGLKKKKKRSLREGD